MTIQEINQKISEMRGEWLLLTGGGSIVYRIIQAEIGRYPSAKPVEWQADANWPTLLQELLSAGCRLQLMGLFHFALWTNNFTVLHANVDANSSLGAKICQAWITWKYRQIGGSNGNQAV